MSILDSIAGLFRRPDAVRALPAAGAGRIGQPSYASYWGVATVPRPMEYRLLRQFLRSVPALSRAIDVLSGFAGIPVVECESERETEDLRAWLRSVPYCDISTGIACWMRDHLAQTLTYGYGVGEIEVAESRAEIARLWSYLSPQFAFETKTEGGLSVIQPTARGGKATLDPVTAITTTHNPEGGDPYGRSLFFALPTFCQVWSEAVYAHRAAQRRSGIPVFHVHIEMPPEFDDPDGKIAAGIVAAYEAQWNEGTRSQSLDGRAKDFFTCSVGKVTVNAIGVGHALMDLEQTKRQIVEEITVGVGIPPFLLGYSWSSTERMSRQQADMLLSYIDVIRAEAEPAYRKIIDLRQRLTGRKAALAYTISWPDVNLQDLIDTARAALMDAQADESRERFARTLWANGVLDQAGYAEHVTGKPDVAAEQDAPVAPPSAGAPVINAELIAPASEGRAAREAAEREADAEYPGLRHDPDCRCGRRMAADDPTQLFPSEEPQYEGLTREIARAWRATRAAFAVMREDWFQAAGLDDPATARAGRAMDPLAGSRINAAIDQFLREFAGSDRSADGFATDAGEDGILQQAEYLSYTVGWQRGQTLTERQANLEFTAAQREALLRDAYARLSDGSRLRFEGRLDEIRRAMVAALEAGDNPLSIARKLGRDLDGYEAGRLKTIIRTEMAFASEAGINDQYRAAGAIGAEIIGDPNTDAACTSLFGRVYTLDEARVLVPAHPGCYCTQVPVMPEE